MAKGAFRDAFTIIADVEAARPEQLFQKVALMADSGVALRNLSMLEYGLYLLERHEKDLAVVPAYAPYYWINLGHLRSNLLAIAETEGSPRCWYNRTLSAPARTAYRNALSALDAVEDASLPSPVQELKVQILNAHAHLLLGLGRDREAFELFHDSLALNSQNPDARLGRSLTLSGLAGTAPQLETNLLLESLTRLAPARDPDTAPAPAVPRDESQKIEESLLKRLKILTAQDAPQPDYPKNTIITADEQEHTTVMYSLRHRLYLGPCASCRKCDHAVGDSLGFGPRHAAVGGSGGERYRRSAVLLGRIVERYRSLRLALINHHRGINTPQGPVYTPSLEDWRSLSSSSSALVSQLAGIGSLMEGMAAYIALSLDRKISSPVRPEHILGTPKSPSSAVKDSSNPALHAFWDLWADGIEDQTLSGGPFQLLSGSLSHPGMEELLHSPGRLETHTLKLLNRLALLIQYLMRIPDRTAASEPPPPLWPLNSCQNPSF